MRAGYCICAAVFSAILTVTIACQTHPSDVRATFRSSAQKQTASIFDLYFDPKDHATAQDVARALTAHLDRLRGEFHHPFEHRIVVEIYPDQAAYDAHLIDPWLAGSPACSGRHAIQMVSPTSPIRIPGLPYETRLTMAVHELAHLFIDELNQHAPSWLDEGVASYQGDAAGYRALCRLPQIAKILETPPVFTTLENSYSSLPAPDIYSFTAVEYIVERYGWSKVVELIRSPAKFEKILGISKDEFTRGWHRSLQLSASSTRLQQ